jgi:hypothetical protein
MIPHITLGLESTQEPITSLDEMRARIAKGGRNSHIIRNAMIQADIEGYGGEDRYTLLAYHALVALEHYYKEALRRLMLDPNVPPILRGSTDSGGTEHG